ncbi:Imm70 family immunity protein [Alicyclobacillus dauci]|uniref:Immunity 70 family protein n=1 Tax=Alicyclobacillus dauci TaxID=1475485 RepID=A0ABY6Z7E0_9BACL|nr:Imm70 family immunity protein [Alicyclobacillus dauci]WAH38665.1 immunity 70 family protein [Alicyclobacillus dauci]
MSTSGKVACGTTLLLIILGCRTVVYWGEILSKQPWGTDITAEITSLSNYFVTSDGRDLFEVLFLALMIDLTRKTNTEIG